MRAWLPLTGLLVLAGCDEEKSDPQATVVFVHEAPQLGAIDILANDEGVVDLDTLGDISKPLTLDTGPTTIAVRNQGASANLVTTQIDLQPRLYLLAASSNPMTGAPEIWTIDQTPPETGDEETAVEVVNLDPGDDGDRSFKYDVYIDDVRVADNLANDRSASSFVTVPSGVVTLSLFAPGADPTMRALEEVPLELPGGTSVMVPIKADAEQNLSAEAIELE